MAIDFKSLFSSQFFTRFQFDILRRLASEVQANIDWDAILNKPAVFPPGPHPHDAADIVTGQFADARISQSSVTQHQAALAIAWSQITSKPTTLAGYGITDAVDTFSAQNIGGNKTFTANTTFAANIVGGINDWRIFQPTLDGSDDRRIIIHSGGAVSNTRGAYLLLQGNEYAGGGVATLAGGLNADIQIAASGSGNVNVSSTTGGFNFNGNAVWHAGNFTPGNYVRLDTSIQSLTQATDWRIAASTPAGSDTLALRLQSGGAFSTARGAILELNGANAAANAGGFRLLGMSGTTSQLNGGIGSTVQLSASTFQFTSSSTLLIEGITRFRSGTVGAQRVHTSFGWNDGVQRWTTAMESDASFSFYNYDTSGASSSRLLNMIGANMGAARLQVFGELTGHLDGGAVGQLRAVGGNYGAFFRNDGTNLYLLMTSSGDQYGTYNTLRPLTVSVTTGLVTAGNGLAFGSVTGASNTDLSKHIALYGTSYGFSVTGSRLNYVASAGARHTFVVNGVDSVSIGAANASDTMLVPGSIRSTGTGAILHTYDRTSSRQWGWYGTSDIFRLWNGSSDIATFTAAGVATATNWVATSDRRLKHDDGVAELYDQLDTLRIHDFRWKKGNGRGRGPMAQDVQKVAPAYVFERDGILSIDKGGLALEVALLALRLALQRKQA